LQTETCKTQLNIISCNNLLCIPSARLPEPPAIAGRCWVYLLLSLWPVTILRRHLFCERCFF